MSPLPAKPSPLRVLVTRPVGTWPGLGKRFDGSRIEVVVAPTTVQIEPADPRPGDEALTRLATYRWLVLTSGQGVKALLMKLATQGRLVLPPRLRVAAVGPATARALEGSGVAVDVVADDARAEGLAAALGPRLAAGERVLLVRPEGTHGLLPAALRARGAHVDEAPLYRTVASDRAPALAGEAIEGAFAAVVFTAPSCLELWLEASKERRTALERALGALVRVAIGPATAAFLDEKGLAADAVAETPDERAVGDAIARALGVATC